MAKEILKLEVTQIDERSRERFYDLITNLPEPSLALKKLLAVEEFRVVT
jgi:hypothetical protein